ncbi:MAG: signal peptide peptidase SppA [bacterium]
MRTSMRGQRRGRGIAASLALVLVLVFALSYAAGRLGLFRGGGLPLSQPKIGVILIQGVLADSRPVIEELERYKEREDVKALVFRIDSPGGTVVAAQEVYAEIRKLRGQKITLSSLGNVAASGGYYVASATEEILANPGTVTGSIGVISEYANVEELLRKIGLRSTVLKAGRFKDAGSPFREMTPEEEAYMQSLLDSIHKQFIRDVAQGRRKTPDEIEPYSDGRVFTGEQAHEIGLVDRLGDFQDALDRAAELAGIEGKPVILYPEEEKLRFLDYLIGSFEGYLRDMLLRVLQPSSPGCVVQ